MTQFQKHDEGKTKWSYLPITATEEVVKVIYLGSQKYGKDNWRKAKDLDRLFDACIRHLFSWKRGEKYDEESRYSPLAHAAANILFMLEVLKDTENTIIDESLVTRRRSRLLDEVLEVER